MNELDTPNDMKKPGKDVPAWLAYKLGEIHSDITTTNGKVDTVITEVKKINGNLQAEIQRSKIADTTHDARLDTIDKKSKDHDVVSFKWLLEKLALPVIMLVIGGAIALLFG